jgi:peptide/nickel transport system permease protein
VVIGLTIIVALTVVAVGAPVIAPYDPLDQDYEAILAAPSPAHLLGTDNLGRDVFTRLVYGAQVSLQVGIIAVGIATAAGVALGLLAGYFGGLVDDVIMRVVDALLAFPALLLILAISAALGPSLLNTTVAIGVVSVPAYARLVRSQVLTVRELDYVAAARTLGAGHGRIMLTHVLPNAIVPTIVLASLSTSGAILTEATLSFLGVGVPPPAPSWGSMMQTGFQYLALGPWMSMSAGGVIFLAVLGFNLLGDGLRTVLDPRIRV